MRLIVNIISVLSIIYTCLYFNNISIDHKSSSHSYDRLISSIDFEHRTTSSVVDFEALSSYSELFYFDNSDKVFAPFISKFKLNIFDISLYREHKNFYVYIFSGISPPFI